MRVVEADRSGHAAERAPRERRGEPRAAAAAGRGRELRGIVRVRLVRAGRAPERRAVATR